MSFAALRRFAAIVAFGGLGLAAPGLAQSPSPTPPPAQSVEAAQSQLAADPLNTNAPYAFILDGDTGQTLYSKRGDEELVPASMSKLMTYYIVFSRLRDGRLKLEDEFTVSENAWRKGGAGTDGSTMFLPLNSRVSIENLLKGAIVVSGNDACIVLAEGIAGSEEAFAREMTAKAKEIGMTGSTFVNATGLDADGHRMTAHDIAVLGYRIIKDFPEFYPWFSETSFEWNGIRQPNRNPLLKELPGADGIKTGHLSVSGFGLVGSAVRDGKRRIVVLQGLGSETERRMEGARVMRAAFSDFATVELVAQNAQVGEAEVWLGQAKTVPLVTTEARQIGLHVDAAKAIKAKVVYKGPLRAPLKAGDVVGELVVSAPGVSEVRIPVAAGADVKRLGLIGRAAVGMRGE
jgi:serine-type D-Ala-D-Ala carboxypeptidase (penicillin-binding protein 5/6)